MEGQSHRTINREDSKKEQAGSTNADARPMGVPYSLEEIKGMKGDYDEDGFYVLEDGTFFDPWGYKFDAEGYDEFGGYYDDDGHYVPGEGYEEEYYKNYQQYDEDDAEIEQYVASDEEEGQE